jgi:hypothetical protein
MKITLEYSTLVEKTFSIPKNSKWEKFFKAWLTDDDERTDADWDILDENDIYDFLQSQGISANEVELIDYK